MEKSFPHRGIAECRAKVQLVGRMANARSIAHGERRASERDFASGAATCSAAGFTLIELLIVIAVLLLLAALSAGLFPAALDAARSAACKANLRALAAANIAYAADHNFYVAAASDIDGPNTRRWHGTRTGSSFDAAQGPLTPYLGGTGTSRHIRRCPAFRPPPNGFEASCGGYGYNAHGVGSQLSLTNGAGHALGMPPAALARPAHTLMFADTAYLQGSGANATLIEYSFAEPPAFAGGGSAWPTLHFRHRTKANIAWCDGRVTSEPLLHAPSRFAHHHLGWFTPDNAPFEGF